MNTIFYTNSLHTSSDPSQQSSTHRTLHNLYSQPIMPIRFVPLLFVLLAFIYQSTVLHAQDTKPLVVASASIFADIATAIGDTLILVSTIVPVGGDPHIYEPTPGDVRLILQADLILQNGLTFEGWISDLIRNSGSKAPVITLTDGITPITSEEHQNATDPHAWMDPHNGKIYALNTRNALMSMLPANSTQIQEQYDRYIRQLDELDLYIRQQISRIDSAKRILITSHDAFQYYGIRYGLQLESVMGTSTDADVRTSDLIRLTQVIRQYKVPVVFIESTINPKLLEQVASDNKISVGGKLYSDSLGEKDSPASTYIGMLRYNTDIIVAGLTKEAGHTAANDPKGKGRFWILIIIVLLATALGLIFYRRKLRPA